MTRFAKAVALLTCAVVFWALPANATTDYTFVVVNGDSTATSMVQGDTISWGANCAIGASLHWVIAVDLNDDSTYNSGTDLLVTEFNTADGDTSNSDGEGDINGTPDGWFQSGDLPVGIAPRYYIFRCTDLTDSSWSEDGLAVLPLALPPNTISGAVAVPGVTAPSALLENIWVEATYEGDTMSFWSGLTNDNGAYNVNVGPVGTGLSHRVSVNSLAGYIEPPSQDIVPLGNMTNVNFVYQLPTDSVYGQIQDEFGAPILRPLELYAYQPSGSVDRNHQTSTGTYVLYFGAAETGQWWAGIDDRSLIPDYLVPDQYEMDYQGSSFPYLFTCYGTDSSIWGQITVAGAPPTVPLRVQARSNAVGWTQQVVDTAAAGLFELSVSSQDPSNWEVSLPNWDEDYPIPAGFILEGGAPSGVSVGDTVFLNLISGRLVSDALILDPGDPAVDWNDVQVYMSGSGASYDGTTDSNGIFTVYSDTGIYTLNVQAGDYLSLPDARTVAVTGDTTGGISFTLNHRHVRLWGTLTNVVLPLVSPVWINAETAPWPNGYHASVQVDSATGTYELWVCDGNWTVSAPYIDGYDAPGDTSFALAEAPDTSRNLNIVYSVATGIGEDGTLPSDFALGQNYPNPFNATTKIEFALDQPGHVRLVVFDLLGRSVRTVVDANMPAGATELTWNGRDDRGREVATGVYFYRMEAAGRFETRKLVLLK